MNDASYVNDIDNYSAELNNIDNAVVKARYIILFFILSTVFSSLSGITDASGSAFLAARAFLGSLLILSVIMPTRFGIPLFLTLLFVGPDMVQASSEKLALGEYNTASVWRLYLGPVRPSWVMFGCILIQILRTSDFRFDKCVKVGILWFATVPVVTGAIYGGFTSFAWSTEVPADLRFGLILLGSIILFRGYLKKYPNHLGLILAVFVGCVLGRHFVDLVYWFVGYGPLKGGVSRVSVDSTKSTVVFALLFAIYLFVGKKRFLLGSVIGMVSGLLIIVYATRLIWLTAGLCCVILMYIFGAKRAVIVVPIVLIVAFGALKVVRYFRPEAAEVLAQRAESFVVRGPGNFFQRLDQLRYAQLINTMSVNAKRFALFWGSGYGSFYTDEACPFPRALVDGFPEYSATTGKFYLVHNYLIRMLFKYGIIGTVIITALWLWPAWLSYRLVFDKGDPGLFNGLLGCLVAFMPNAIINLYWSGKGVFLSGALIAMLLTAVEHYKNLQAETYLPYTDSNATDEASASAY